MLPWRSAPLLLWLAAAACCSTECRDENLPPFKDRASPIRTMKLVRHGVTHDCGDLLYDTLDARTQEEFGRFIFKLYYDEFEHPRLEVPIVNMVRGMILEPPENVGVQVDGRKALVAVSTDFVGRDSRPATEILWVILHEEVGEWKVNARETLEANR